MLVDDDNPIPSLFELCKRSLIRNVDHMEDVGDVPFFLLRNVLNKVESPVRLHALEEKCPQLVGETADIWRNLIRRDFGPDVAGTIEPRDPKNWYKVYRKLEREKTKKDTEDIARLKEAMDKLKKKKDDRTIKFIPKEKLRGSEIASMKRADMRLSSGASSRFGENHSIGYKSALRGHCISGKNTDILRKTQQNGVFKSAALNKILRKR